ncbi:CDP-alcohol phosphatidyltransferase family protein [Indioceanicola profundi]|uniref:CDP-alcohol phosphatidyltransferase family protein n=1 Tax=Indioceanicola profundi TaxID=2220096 RepID=UPI000E6AAB8B|nr:CDP-alcohol phosphatidyltransferase family protein [Indioceanicola profundi]
MSIGLHPSSAGADHTLARQVAAHLAVAAAIAAGAGAALGEALGMPVPYAAGSLAVFLLVAANAARGLPLHAPHRRWGDANRVTLARGVLISLVGGALAVIPHLGAAGLWAVSAIAVMALALDGADGWVARRQRMSSEYGARFDMGLDTLLTLILALLLWRLGEAGPWVLLAGLLRHLFVLAGMAVPRLQGRLPFSQRRRVVCVVQIAALAAGLTPLVGPPWTGLAAGAALGLLLFSFLVDTVWLLRQDGRPDVTHSEGRI